MTVKRIEELKDLSCSIFIKAGVAEQEANRVSEHLVNANLVGVDSHGVIRIPLYIEWISDGTINVNGKMEVIKETPVMALIDGHSSFGQVVAAKAAQIAAQKAKKQGISIVSFKNASHIGRLGEYAEMIANESLIGLIMVNGQGAGQYVAPLGGKERRLSVNPFAWGIPTGQKELPIILDISTTVVAEGKIMVMKNKGKKVPEGWIIDAEGQPTTDPDKFYGPPVGSLLPLGMHKGFGLSLVIDILSGGLSGGGCSREGVEHFQNAGCIIAIDPGAIQDYNTFIKSVDALIKYVKTSETIYKNSKIMVPFEPEWYVKQRRKIEGIEIEEDTWKKIVETAKNLGLKIDE